MAKYQFEADPSECQSKVYLVTKGTYSDYHVCAVFSTRERAAEWVAAQEEPYSGDLCVEEFPFDVPVAEWYKWEVFLHTKTGEVESSEKLRTFTCEQARFPWDTGDRVISARGRTEEHAIKVAGEMRTRWLIEHAGDS